MNNYIHKHIYLYRYTYIDACTDTGRAEMPRSHSPQGPVATTCGAVPTACAHKSHHSCCALLDYSAIVVVQPMVTHGVLDMISRTHMATALGA